MKRTDAGWTSREALTVVHERSGVLEQLVMQLEHAARVTDTAGVDLEAGDRAEIDDMSARGAPKQREHRLGNAKEAQNIGLHHLHPIIVATFGERLQPGGQARVVDQDLDLRVFSFNGTNKRLDAVEVLDIEGNGQGPELLRDSSQAILPTGAEHQGEAFAGEGARRCLADSRARTRYHGNSFCVGHDLMVGGTAKLTVCSFLVTIRILL